jgi:tRNA uridine 5-carboxymethylaminomethyl modification enzyme
MRGGVAAARPRARRACTLGAETVARTPCNPAIGGTAKGHLVREIDALGGLMSAIDATGIHSVANRSRGPRSGLPGAPQEDLWRLVRTALESEPNIEW